MEQSDTKAILSGVQKERHVVLLRFSDGTEIKVASSLFRALKLDKQAAAEKESLLKRIDALQYPAARQKAFALLTMRNRSEKALRDALLRSGYDDAIVNRVLAALTESGFLNDRTYAESLIRQRDARGFGRKRILLDLLSKGVDRDTAEISLDDFYLADGDRGSALQKSAEKAVRGRDLSERKDRQKAVASLMRKGFSLSEALAGIDAQK